jgi:hypothetical protein
MKNFIASSRMISCWQYLYPSDPLPNKKSVFIRGILNGGKQHYKALVKMVKVYPINDQSLQFHSVVYLQKNFPALKDHLYCAYKDGRTIFPYWVNMQLQKLMFQIDDKHDLFLESCEGLGVRRKLLPRQLHSLLDTSGTLSSKVKTIRYLKREFELSQAQLS